MLLISRPLAERSDEELMLSGLSYREAAAITNESLFPEEIIASRCDAEYFQGLA